MHPLRFWLSPAWIEVVHVEIRHHGNDAVSQELLLNGTTPAGNPNRDPPTLEALPAFSALPVLSTLPASSTLS